MSSHALLSPSSSERWINCTKSAIHNAGGDTGSTYAQQGTDAHALCEYKVKNPRFIALHYSELLRNYVEPDGSSDSHAMADIHIFYHR